MSAPTIEVAGEVRDQDYWTCHAEAEGYRYLLDALDQLRLGLIEPSELQGKATLAQWCIESNVRLDVQR